MQSPQQENRSHTLMHSSASLPIFPVQETSFLPPVDARKSSQSLWDLTLVQFLYLDLNKLNIHPLNKVADTSSQEECVLEIEISDVPCLQVARNFQEITAFCNILMIKFSDAKWPERLSEYDTSRDKDQWTKTLMKAIEKVLELAKTSPPQKRTALCILYAFLIDKETAEKIRKESILSPSGKSPIRSETRQSRSWSDGHIEISLDKTTEILLNAVRELEIKAQGMDIDDDDDYAEGAMAKMDLENKNKDHTPQANSNPEIDTEKLDDTFQGRKSSVKHDSLILKKNLSSGQKEARQALSLQDNNINSQSSDIGVRNGAVAAEVEALNQIKMAAKSETPKVKVGEKIKDFFSRAFTKKVYSEPLKVEQIKSDKTEKAEKVEKVEKTEKIEKVEKPEKVEPSPAPISKEPKDLNVIPLIQNLSDMSIWRDLSIETPREQSENDISMDRDSEDFYEKRRDTRDGSRTARSEDSIKNSPSHQDLSKLIKKEIPNFAGQIYMKLSAASTWNKYFARLHDSNLVLYSSPSDKAPVHVIPCFRSTISYVEKPEKDYIEIFHKFDSERVQILMDPNSQGQNDSHDPFKNLRMWYIQLKIITQKTHGLKLPFNNYYPIGKVQLTVSQASQIKGLPNNSTCYIRIYHIPYTLSTRQITASETLKWKQSFFLPLCDNFLPIKLELVSVFHEGWLKDTIKEEVICTKDIRATDIISLKLDGTFTVNLNMQYTEAKRKLLGKSILTPEGEVIHPTIKLKIKHLSTMHVLFSPAYGDFVEGVHMDRETYVKQHFKLSIRRVKRIVRYIKLFIADFNSIFYYKYPVFSYFCILLFSYVIVVTQVENLLANFVFLIVLFSVYKNPKVESRIKPILTEIFFREDLRNSYYSVPTVKSLEDIATQKDLNTEKWKFKIVDEDNLVTQLLVIKRILTGISIGLTKAAGFCEKLKNIILWKEPARTSLFICFGVVIYCVLALLPLRWSLLLIVWLRFLQGMDYYKKLRTRNEEVAKMTINFIVKRSFPAYCQQIWRRPNAIWPTALNFVNFQKKMIDQLNFRLGVVLPDDALCVLKSPQELVTALATCSKSLKFKTNQTEKANLAMVRWKDPTFNAKNLLNFIMNAPSDYYRVTHPNVIHPEPDSPTLSEDISPR